MLQKPDPGISATPTEQNARHFNVVIAGPQDSAYDGASAALHQLCHCSTDERARWILRTRDLLTRVRVRPRVWAETTGLLRRPVLASSAQERVVVTPCAPKPITRMEAIAVRALRF
jgi:hypothetical protein